MGASSLTISVEVAFVLSEVDSKNYRAYFARTQNEMFVALHGRAGEAVPPVPLGGPQAFTSLNH